MKTKRSKYCCGKGILQTCIRTMAMRWMNKEEEDNTVERIVCWIRSFFTSVSSDKFFFCLACVKACDVIRKYIIYCLFYFVFVEPMHFCSMFIDITPFLVQRMMAAKQMKGVQQRTVSRNVWSESVLLKYTKTISMLYIWIFWLWIIRLIDISIFSLYFWFSRFSLSSMYYY